MSASDKDKENEKGSTDSLAQLPARGGRAFALEVDKAVDERSKKSSEEAERMNKELEFKEATLSTQSQSLEKIKNILHCSICMEYMLEPYGLTCGHVACFSCLHSWFTRDTEDSNPRTGKVCPSCRAPIRSRPNELFIIKELAQITAAAHGETLEAPPTREGDVWARVFRPGGEFQPVEDREDGVMRCGRCTGELVGGVCSQCGEVYTDVDTDEWDDEEEEEEEESEEDVVSRNIDQVLGLDSWRNREEGHSNWDEEGDEGDENDSERENVRNLLTATDQVRRMWQTSIDRDNDDEHSDERSDHSNSSDHSHSLTSSQASRSQPHSSTSSPQRLSPASAFFGGSDRPGWEQYHEDEEDDFINNSRSDASADNSSNDYESEEDSEGSEKGSEESKEDEEHQREYDHWLPNQAESSSSAPFRGKKVIVSDEDDE